MKGERAETKPVRTAAFDGLPIGFRPTVAVLSTAAARRRTTVRRHDCLCWRVALPSSRRATRGSAFCRPCRAMKGCDPHRAAFSRRPDSLGKSRLLRSPTGRGALSHFFTRRRPRLSFWGALEGVEPSASISSGLRSTTELQSTGTYGEARDRWFRGVDRRMPRPTWLSLASTRPDFESRGFLGWRNLDPSDPAGWPSAAETSDAPATPCLSTVGRWSGVELGTTR